MLQLNSMLFTDVPSWFVIASFIVLLAVLAFDIFLAFRRPHVPTTKESVAWVSFYVALALVFALLLWRVTDGELAGQFVAGWLTEYSLSVDNLFIFLIIMARFAVPQKYLQSMLMVGIIAALIFRAIFIVVGIHLVESFSWLFYLFAVIILYAAINQLLTGHQDEEEKENRFISFLRAHIPMTDTYDGTKLRTVRRGVKVFTPVILVYITLGTTDLILALDSIPAIFAITQNAFLIIVANIFALMGLRQLYFLLGTLVKKLVFLKYGISAILLFIAVKLIGSALNENAVSFINNGQPVHFIPHIPTVVSLSVIVGVIAVSVLASLVHMRLTAKK